MADCKPRGHAWRRTLSAAEVAVTTLARRSIASDRCKPCGFMPGIPEPRDSAEPRDRPWMFMELRVGKKSTCPDGRPIGGLPVGMGLPGAAALSDMLARSNSSGTSKTCRGCVPIHC